MGLLVLLGLCIMAFLFLLPEKTIEDRGGWVIFIAILFFFLGCMLVVFFTIRKAETLSVANSDKKVYFVKDGMSMDNEFVFSNKLQNLVIYQRNEKSFKKIYYNAKDVTKGFDKDLYLMYNKIEREKLKDWFLFFPYQSIKKEYNLTNTR